MIKLVDIYRRSFLSSTTKIIETTMNTIIDMILMGL